MKVIALLCVIFALDSLQEECSICDQAEKVKVESLLSNATDFMTKQENYLKNYTEKLQKRVEQNNTAIINSIIEDIEDKFYLNTSVDRSMLGDCFTKLKENVEKEFTPARTLCRILTLQIAVEVLVGIENSIRETKEYIANIKRDVCREDIKPPACVTAVSSDLSKDYEKIRRRRAYTKTTSNRVAQIAIEMNNACLRIRIMEIQMRDQDVDRKVEQCVEEKKKSGKK